MDFFESKILSHWPWERWEHYRLLLAVSGGADSVALVRCFESIVRQKMAKNDSVSRHLFILHVNHHLRGEESDGDALFVRQLAKTFSLPFEEADILPQTLAAEAEKEGSLESAARNIRYRLLIETAERLGARFILTAHHRDDQLETILYRLFRGSGINGLTGMASFRPLNDAVVLTRPLLPSSRAEILEYLNRLDQPFRVDSSNLSPEFLRNRIRNELIPLLGDLFPNQFDRSLLRFARQCQEIQSVFNETLEDLEKKIKPTSLPAFSLLSAKSLCLACDDFAETPPYLLGEYFRRLWEREGWPLREMGTVKWQTLASMIREGTPKRYEFPGGVAARLENSSLILTPPLPTSPGKIPLKER